MPDEAAATCEVAEDMDEAVLAQLEDVQRPSEATHLHWATKREECQKGFWDQDVNKAGKSTQSQKTSVKAATR